jgi:hypothetical protein
MQDAGSCLEGRLVTMARSHPALRFDHTHHCHCMSIAVCVRVSFHTSYLHVQQPSRGRAMWRDLDGHELIRSAPSDR